MKLIASIAIIIALTISIYIGGFVFSSSAPARWEAAFRPKDRRAFEPKEWRDTSAAKERYKMANDLVTQKELHKMESEAVLMKLGSPDEEVKKENEKSIMIYDLVSQQEMPAKSVFFPKSWFLNIEEWSLYIVFESNRVVDAFIRIK